MREGTSDGVEKEKSLSAYAMVIAREIIWAAG